MLKLYFLILAAATAYVAQQQYGMPQPPMIQPGGVYYPQFTAG